MNSIPETDKAFTLLAAIVAGDAEIDDGVAELKKEGISSLEDVLTIMKERTSPPTAINFQELRGKAPRDVESQIVHRVPEVPFQLNGTLYDPADVTRFNGQELHFIARPNSDRMLAVDNRDLVVDWYQYAYFERYRDGVISNPSDADVPVTRELARAATFGSIFFEHMNLDGGSLWCPKDRGFVRLSQLYYDWNDKISSFSMDRTQVVVLYEDTYYQGNTFSWVLPYGTVYGEVLYLDAYGWNDRASSVGTW